MNTQLNNSEYRPEYNAYLHVREGCDIKLHKNLHEPRKYKGVNWTFEAILKEAVLKGCNIIVKNGSTTRANWYLKHADESLEHTMQEIENSKTKKSYKKRCLYYIDYRNI